MSEPLLKIKNLKKYFPVTKGLLFGKTVGWIKAVDDVTFDLYEGETFALVGESGCGKTTISRVILLLYRPTDGAILFKGKNPHEFNDAELKEYRRSVQSIFQDPFGSLNVRLRTGTIIAEPLVVNNAMPRSAIKERVKELLLKVGLTPDDSQRFPHEFSGGQRQRIALARAIALNPKLVVLDEPVSALDVSIRSQIMNLLKDLQGQLGLAYFLIAHNLATVRYMSQRIGIMYLGRLVEIAETEELFNHPFHPYTESLISASLSVNPNIEREEIVLSGEVPSALDIPPGCRFHPRCFKRRGVCSEEEPLLKEVRSGHWVACHLN